MADKIIKEAKLLSGCICTIMEASQETLHIEMTNPEEGLAVFTPSAIIFVHKKDLYDFKQLIQEVDKYLLKK